MRQPELGKKLVALRQEKNMTQEELVEACNVSVRTIQRIESGEVTPRTSTIKILLTALDSTIDSFDEPESNGTPSASKQWLQIAWIAGIVYLLLGSVESFLDYERFELQSPDLSFQAGSFPSLTTIAYISTKIVSYSSYVLFILGLIHLAKMFENSTLKIGAILMIAVSGLLFFTDTITLFFDIDEVSLITLFAFMSVISGASGIIFGIGLFKLQDGMGRTAQAAGILEIIIGACFGVVVLFFLGFILTVPAVIIEVILLYKGYEILRKESLLG